MLLESDLLDDSFIFTIIMLTEGENPSVILNVEEMRVTTSTLVHYTVIVVVILVIIF